MWEYRSIDPILSCNNGLSCNINMVQSYRRWLLPRVARSYLQTSTLIHQGSRWNGNGPHGSTQNWHSINLCRSQWTRLHGTCTTNSSKWPMPPCLYDNHQNRWKALQRLNGKIPDHFKPRKLLCCYFFCCRRKLHQIIHHQIKALLSTSHSIWWRLLFP